MPIFAAVRARGAYPRRDEHPHGQNAFLCRAGSAKNGADGLAAILVQRRATGIGVGQARKSCFKCE